MFTIFSRQTVTKAGRSRAFVVASNGFWREMDSLVQFVKSRLKCGLRCFQNESVVCSERRESVAAALCGNEREPKDKRANWRTAVIAIY